jgi:hypothetical protein
MLAFVGTLKCKRRTGRLAVSVEGSDAATRRSVVLGALDAADPSSEGSNVEPTSITARAPTRWSRRITSPAYRVVPAHSLTIGLRKGFCMAMIKTVGVIVVVLLALWLVFALVGVLTAIIKSVLLILIVVVICYGVYHHFKRH